MGEFETPLSLSSLCEGELEQKFQEMYPALISQLKHGETVSIGIKLDFKRVENTDTMIQTNFSIKPTFPARGRAAICQVGKDNILKGEKPKEKVKNLSLLEGGAVNG